MRPPIAGKTARALLGPVGAFGGAAALIAELNSSSNGMDVLRASAGGAGLLVFLVGMGLAELIDRETSDCWRECDYDDLGFLQPRLAGRP